MRNEAVISSRLAGFRIRFHTCSFTLHHFMTLCTFPPQVEVNFRGTSTVFQQLPSPPQENAGVEIFCQRRNAFSQMARQTPSRSVWGRSLPRPHLTRRFACRTSSTTRSSRRGRGHLRSATEQRGVHGSRDVCRLLRRCRMESGRQRALGVENKMKHGSQLQQVRDLGPRHIKLPQQNFTQTC